MCRKEIQRRKKWDISLEPNTDEIFYNWSKSTIGKILTNETYIGNVVQNRTTTVSYKNHKIIYKPREEWAVVENTHEAIISKEDYQKVQDILKDRNFERKQPTGLTIYYGKIKCADCGTGMCKMEDTREGRNTSNYYCRNYKTTSSNCSPHKIKTTALNHLVLKTILMQVKLVIDLEKTINKLKDDGKQKEIERTYSYNINRLTNDIDKYKRLKRSSYEDWKLGNISKEQFLNYSNDYDKQIENINNEISALKNVYNENIQNLKKDNYWIDHFKKNKNIKTLTREIIYELIDTIYVHEGGNITIKFKYQDEYKNALEFLELKEASENE